MEKPGNAPAQPNYSFERITADCQTGLNAGQVQQRMAAGAHNAPPAGVTSSVPKIFLKNICTLFNLINFVLALAVILVGSPRNALFFGIAICNTAMGIFQELRAKRTLDKLAILARGHATVVREGENRQLPQEEVVLDDILVLHTGDQICADGTVAQSEGLEVDESLLTGEADAIRKPVGERVLSGSFVVAGTALVRVGAVGGASYAGTLTVQAKQEKKANTPLMRTLNRIIGVLAIVIIPIGLLLFFTQYDNPDSTLASSVLGAAAAMIGMIPEGLVLLTGLTLTMGALKLARQKALVQSLYSIETLARVDVLCLDKTGTITDGTLSFEEVVPFEGATAVQMTEALGEMTAALGDDNPTAKATRAAFSREGQWPVAGLVPFSSARKWSAVAFEGKGSYVMGAPSFVFPRGDEAMMKAVEGYASKGFRVLCLAHTPAALPAEGLPQNLACLGLVVYSDTIRAEAPKTFRFFAREGVTLKVISGDDALTVSTIAAKAGISGAEKYLDLTGIPAGADFTKLVKQYTVFGRVTPEQKKALVAALKAVGHTVCMTGDGVNDVLAMKEADCAVAMINGSDASRGAADFVLMTSNFSAMVQVLREGRRVINNIENVASLYLVKTIYSTILSVLYVFIPAPYPFAPLQMTPINGLTVGVPSFFLALRENYEKPEGRFLANVLENSVPAALVVVLDILIIRLAGWAFGLSQLEVATMNVLLTGTVGFTLLRRVSQPIRLQERLLLIGLPIAFLLAFLLLGDFFMLGSLFTRNIFFYLPLMIVSPRLFEALARGVHRVELWWQQRKTAQPQA